MRVKERKRVGLRLKIKKKKKTGSWHTAPLLHGKQKAKRLKKEKDKSHDKKKIKAISSSWAPKSLQTVTAAMKSEEDCFLAGKR